MADQKTEVDNSDNLMIDGKPSNVITLITNNNTLNADCNKNVPRKKEDEQITTAVMKVLQGYQWSLVPNTTK